ncbi:MAG: hypothetical protein HQK98_05830 [Nitrospirae bacterium]|nr:hypothetical protein [Nitrospirota bacterium]
MYETALKIIGDMPLKKREPLLDLLSSDLSPDEFNSALLKIGKNVDLSKYRHEIAETLIAVTGICDAVPEAYKDFRSVVYDGAMFLLSGISQGRLLRVLNGQFLIGMDASPGQRLITLVKDIPMLYKLGQIMARNPNIGAHFSHWLTMLEGGLIHIDISTIRGIIEAEIGTAALAAHAVEMSNNPISEASVAAVVSFTWREGELGGTGVFKVVKPNVPGFLAEDLRLLDELAELYTKNRDKYALGDFQFIGTFKDVKYALSKEVDLRNEQRNMKLAREFYEDNRRIKIPALLPFSTERVTGMEFIDGHRITQAGSGHKECAVELFKTLVCGCIFGAAESSIFHADPHAGNILIVKDDAMGFRIALIDWSQTGTLARDARASILKLAAGITTNNRMMIIDAVQTLTEGGINGHTSAALPSVIDKELSATPTGIITGALHLLDRLALRGIKFPADLLLFRKAIFTLNGVLLSLDPEFDQDACLINYMFRLLVEEIPQRWYNLFFPCADSPFNYRSLMSNAELFTLGTGLCL